MTTETKPEGDRSFAVFLQTLADGDCHGELSERLHELGASLRQAAQATGGKVSAELSLKLKFKTEGDGTVDVNYDVAIKEPKPLRPRSVFWLTTDGNLSDTVPEQQKLVYPREIAPENSSPIEVENAKATEASDQ